MDAQALAAIQSLVGAQPAWSRRRIAGELVVRWDWRNGVGHLKDMSCRLLLARWEAKGLLRLPARRKVASTRKARLMPLATGIDTRDLSGPLSSIQPVSLEAIRYGTPSVQVFDGLLSQHHYLGCA